MYTPLEQYQLQKVLKYFGNSNSLTQRGGSMFFFGSIMLTAFLVKTLDSYQREPNIRTIHDDLCTKIPPSQLKVVKVFNRLIKDRTPEELLAELSPEITEKFNQICKEILELIPEETQLTALELSQQASMGTPEVQDILLSFKNFFARNPDDKIFITTLIPLIQKSLQEDLTVGEKDILKSSLHDLFTCRKQLVDFLEHQSDKLQHNPQLQMLSHFTNYYEKLINLDAMPP